jgi:hypothetical protein
LAGFLLVSWATGPKAQSANQKEAAYKRPKIKRAGNTQRKHIVHPHSALAVFLTALLTRAGVRTARTLLQRKYRRTRKTQHANGVPFSHHKQNTIQTRTAVWVQGGLVPNKISGVGTNFGLLVHVLPGPNKQRARISCMVLS